eukprot:798961_1
MELVSAQDGAKCENQSDRSARNLLICFNDLSISFGKVFTISISALSISTALLLIISQHQYLFAIGIICDCLCNKYLKIAACNFHLPAKLINDKSIYDLNRYTYSIIQIKMSLRYVHIPSSRGYNNSHNT